MFFRGGVDRELRRFQRIPCEPALVRLRQHFLNRPYRQKHFQFVRRRGNETELLIVVFRRTVFGVHEKANGWRCF